MKKVVVTGGVACGKSTVCELFEKLGAYVVSADAIVHELLSADGPTGQQVIDLLGDGIVVAGAIDRRRIAQQVFGDANKLQALEKILHPGVRDEVARRYRQAQEAGAGLFVVEIPLFYEAGHQDDYDAVVAVMADEAVCKERFDSKAYPADDYAGRVRRQLTQQEKAARADYVINNSGDLKELHGAVVNVYNTLIGSE